MGLALTICVGIAAFIFGVLVGQESERKREDERKGGR